MIGLWMIYEIQEDVKWNSLVKPFVRIELTIFRLLSERFTTKLKALRNP